jgi:glycosyltransferase involved in cell wall biosynthesis
MIYFVTVDITKVGGIEKSLSTLCSELVLQKSPVTIISCFKSNLDPQFSFPGVKIHYIQDGDADFINGGLVYKLHKYAKTFVKLSQYFRKSSPGVVVSVYPMLSIMMTFFLKQEVHRLYGWEHSQFSGHSWLLNSARQLFYYKLEGVFVLTELEKKSYLSCHVNIRVVPNPIELVPFARQRTEEPKIIFVGRMSPEKCPEKFVKIMDSFRDIYGSNFTAKMYGAGALEPRIRKIISDFELDSNIELISDCNDQSKIYDADVFVSTSETEVFGIALVEAMGHGLVTFASHLCNGPNHIIDHRTNGFLVDVNDCSAVALLMVEILNDRKVGLQIGDSARENYRQYSPTVIARTLLGYLHE